MILFIERFTLIDFPFVFDIIKCIKLKDKPEFNGENVDEKNSKNRYNHNYVR